MSNPVTSHLVALLHGPDQKGLVSKVAGWIFDNAGNIVHADQHRDQEEGVFFQRVEWANEGDLPHTQMAAIFREFAASIGMQSIVAVSDQRPKVALFVSRFDHCYHDLILRWKAGELDCDISLVVSNHADLRSTSESYGIPFHYIPVTKDTKPAAEAKQLALLREHQIELVVLARYMQVLTADFLAKFARPVINIHHSFLPAFVGARPYHQAYQRGVKVIGATAHFVTADLDQGPIIHQGVANVTHRHSIAALVQKGRDLEKMTLSQAVRWQLENRVLIYGNKTVVFD
jgi:formyltetrahydrofolate deformylase